MGKVTKSDQILRGWSQPICFNAVREITRFLVRLNFCCVKGALALRAIFGQPR